MAAAKPFNSLPRTVAALQQFPFYHKVEGIFSDSCSQIK